MLEASTLSHEEVLGGDPEEPSGGGACEDVIDDRHSVGVSKEEFDRLFSDGFVSADAVAKDILLVCEDSAGGESGGGRGGDVAVAWNTGVKKFRRIVWPVLLGVGSPPPSTEHPPKLLLVRGKGGGRGEGGNDCPSRVWVDSVMEWRRSYQRLVEEHCRGGGRDLKRLDPQICHPLSSAATNPWTQQKKNEELMAEILQDVQRTFQERKLFQEQSVQSALSRILFIWSRLNNDVSYKQGMNELCAVTYLVCWRDQVVGIKKTGVQIGKAKEEEWETLFSVDEVEADSYAIFSRIMDLGMRSMFATAAVPPSAGRKDVGGGGMSPLPALGGIGGGAVAPLSPVLARCNYVYHVLLRNADPAVYNHLTSMAVEPQLFLLRWIRLMFTREFHVDDILVIWDHIFADIYQRKSFSIPFGSTSDSKQIGRHAAAMMPL
eukprot:GHVQ01024042.1.p1 GENE.GHVQ01024042.1~~GHVQ01024042.1.p1  ORF type:complete len:433 (+),score=72.24 GHVQ01024042.1:899-2197(+)